jgi:hypothetical protein
MSAIDFNQFKGGGQVPAGTDTILQIRVKFGEATDNVLHFTKGKDAEQFKIMLTILDGPYAKGTFWLDLLVKGETEGQKSIAYKNMCMLRLIADSAKNLDPGDESPAAIQARMLQFRDFDGLKFQAIIGVEPARTVNGQTYDSRNVIDKVVTRDMKAWRGPIDQLPPFDDIPFDSNSPTPSGTSPSAPSNGSTAAPPIAKPDWA